MLCLKETDLSIHGWFDSDEASLIQVQLKRCEGSPECKDKETIDSFVKSRFIVLLSNRIRFDSTRYGKESIIEESHLYWLPIRTQV